MTREERLRKAEAKLSAARMMHSRCPDEYRDERLSLAEDVQDALDDFFAAQYEVEKCTRSREKEVTQMFDNDMEQALAPPPMEKAITTAPLVRKAVEFKPLVRVEPDPGLLAKTDSVTGEINKIFEDNALDLEFPGLRELSGESAGDANMRKIHGLPLVAEDHAASVTAHVTIAKSAGVMSDEERQEAYRAPLPIFKTRTSPDQRPVGHSVEKVDPETGERRLEFVVTGYR